MTTSGSRLAGKVAIITGSSRGLGQRCAVGFGREGASVVVAARTVEQKDPRLPGTIGETVAMVEDAGGQALGVPCNVADPDDFEAMVRATIERFGRVDVLVNNAAVQPPGGVSTIQPRHWRLIFDVDVHGVFYGCRAVLPHMVEQGRGSIINVSSAGARRGGPYAAVKRAVEALTIGLAEEVALDGVAVNALLPVGGLDTPGLRFGGALSEEALAALPSGDDYVEAAVRLAFQTPSSCTGAVLDDAQALSRLAARPA